MKAKTTAAMIRWAPKVPSHLIRKLYETDARGIRNEELIDDVGYRILARCESIRRVTERLCPHCAGRMEGRHGGDVIVTCANCGWSVNWKHYRNSYKGKRIHGGRAYPYFVTFLDRFPAARTPEDKMMLIDQVVHAVHEAMSCAGAQAAGNSLIEGKCADVVALLESLAYGNGSIAGAAEVKSAWEEKLAVKGTAKRDRRGAEGT